MSFDVIYLVAWYVMARGEKDTETGEDDQTCIVGPMTPRTTRAQVYRNTPFKAKEEARYDVFMAWLGFMSVTGS